MYIRGLTETALATYWVVLTEYFFQYVGSSVLGVGIQLENAQHCGASLIEYTHRTWSSYMHLTVIRMWLNLRPQKIT